MAFRLKEEPHKIPSALETLQGMEVGPSLEPTGLEEIGRHAARSTSRIAESATGLPGDIFSLLNQFVAAPLVEKATGKKGASYEETTLGKLFPTSTTQRKRSVAKFGKLVEPQSAPEEFVDAVLSDASTLFAPGLGQTKLLKSAGTAALASLAGNTAKETLKDISPTGAEGAKLGTMFLMSLLDKKGAAKFVGEKYGPLEQRAAQLSPVNAVPLETQMQNLQQRVSKGSLAPSEKFVFDEAQEVLDKIQAGRIAPDQVWGLKRSLNEKLIKHIWESPDKAAKARARKLSNNINHALDDTLKLTKRQDPKFFDELKEANKAFAAIEQSKFVSNWMRDNLGYNPVVHGLVHVLGSPIAAAGYVPYQGLKTMYQMYKSPLIRKHYLKVLGAAAAQNSPEFNKAVEQLDKVYEKKYPQSRAKFRLVD